MLHADFEIILVPEDDENQSPEESYTDKYKKYAACRYGYKLVCVDNKFSKSFKPYLGEDAFCNFINNMIEESNCCTDIIKKYFNKELVRTEKDNEDFKNLKSWIFDDDYG